MSNTTPGAIIQACVLSTALTIARDDDTASLSAGGGSTDLINAIKDKRSQLPTWLRRELVTAIIDGDSARLQNVLRDIIVALDL